MIKHIDVIAIGALLVGVALYSEARSSSVLQTIHVQRVALAQSIQRAVQCSRARAAKADRLLVAPHIVAPRICVPRVNITAD